MIKYFNKIEMEYFDVYENHEDNDYTEYVHLSSGNKMSPISFI